MKIKWIIHRLDSHLPPWAASIFSPLKLQNNQTCTSPTGVSTYVLNFVDISHLLSACGRESYLHLGSSLHASVVKSCELVEPKTRSGMRNALVVWNSVLYVYSSSGMFVDATKVFDEIPLRNTISWNTIISGFLSNGDFDEGLRFFKRMRRSDCSQLDQATFTIILSSCDHQELACVNKMVHGLVLSTGFLVEISVANALITSNFKCGFPGSGRQVFDEMPEWNIISWTATISGLAQSQMHEDGLQIFERILADGSVEPNYLTYVCSLKACSGLRALREGSRVHGLVLKLGFQSDFRIESVLMDLYSKCGSVESAWLIFESSLSIDVVSLTVMLVGLAQNGLEEAAIELFVKIAKAGVMVEPDMVSAILTVFETDTSLILGKQIHSLVIKQSFDSNPFVCNGLISMYSKCGNLEESTNLFNQMPTRNSVSWNSLISSFARHGNGRRVLELYEEMKMEGVRPSDVTFLSLLHACSHGGLVGKGMELLKSMVEDHGIVPREEHYACVVDMLGRAGLLDEARDFVEGLPIEPNVLVWQALLGSCAIHKDAQIGSYAAEQLLLLDPQSPSPYVSLANIFSSKNRWRERAQTIRRMRRKGVRKETGISWIEIDKRVHSFVVHDRLHPQGETIYGVLDDLFVLMLDEGYVPLSSIGLIVC